MCLLFTVAAGQGQRQAAVAAAALCGSWQAGWVAGQEQGQADAAGSLS
jgi:hypothetical protein